MSDQEFKENWKEEFQDLRKQVLLWERYWIPVPPKEVTEETVSEYVKELSPYFRRAKIWPLSWINLLVRIFFRIPIFGALMLLNLKIMEISILCCCSFLFLYMQYVDYPICDLMTVPACRNNGSYRLLFSLVLLLCGSTGYLMYFYGPIYILSGDKLVRWLEKVLDSL